MRPKHFKRGALCLLIVLGACSASVVAATNRTTDFRPNDPGYLANPQPLDQVGAPQTWGFATCAGVTVAVVDSGVTPINDLAGALVPGWNVVDNNADTTDDYGHGTAVASVIAAAVNNGLGTAGLCSAAKIMPVKVSDSTGRWTYTNLASGISWAASHGAQVINLSLGGPLVVGGQLTTAAINQAAAAGIVTVAAVGNSGSANPSDNVVASMATEAIRVGGLDANGQLDAESDRGGNWVDVAAPYWVVAEETSGDKYALTKGTSYAAPIVAAGAAMLKSKAPQLMPAQIKAYLMASCTQTIDRSLIACGGAVNLPAALAAAGFTPTPTTTSTTTTTATVPLPRLARIKLQVRGSGAIKLGSKKCKRTCIIKVHSGARLKAVAAANHHWRFAGWQGLCRGAKPKCNLKAHTGTLTARFAKKK